MLQAMGAVTGVSGGDTVQWEMCGSLFSFSLPPPLQDKLQLTHVVQCLAQRRRKDSLMEPEYFQYLLLMLVSIGKARPHNLCLISSLFDSQLAKEMLSQQEEIGPCYNKV
jgi:hypothetical protein